MTTQPPNLGVVSLPPLANDRDKVLWPVLMELADELPKPWTVIGGQMVYFHGLVVGRGPHRYTGPDLHRCPASDAQIDRLRTHCRQSSNPQVRSGFGC